MAAMLTLSLSLKYKPNPLTGERGDAPKGAFQEWKSAFAFYDS